MTRHDDIIALRHMRDHAMEAVTIASNRTQKDLAADRVFALALTKLVEIIGEAANRISLPLRNTQPTIPWNQIVGTRNRLVHGYDQIDFDVLWRIVKDELPILINKLESILSDHHKTE
jgi:uncharacterized protein with HEPN domain